VDPASGALSIFKTPFGGTEAPRTKYRGLSSANMLSFQAALIGSDTSDTFGPNSQNSQGNLPNARD
jgi:hypothetical protein